MSWRISAPGKLMLAGEYSVLGPKGRALAMAVEPGVVLRAEPSDSWALSWPDAGAEWSEGMDLPPSLLFLHAAMVSSRQHFRESTPLRLVSESAFTPNKMGLGGSAGVVTAACAAIQMQGRGEIDHTALLPVALEAHAAAQGGAGSGYDVATCCMGGVISWAPESQFSTRISWPDGLHILAAYSGQSASTTAYLRRLSALRRDNPMALDAELQYLNEPVLELETALSHGNVAEILLLLAECQQRLSDWGEGHELGIMTPNISTLVERAKSMGIVAKVSGAGGGDSVIAVSEDLSALERLTTEWTALSYFCFPISLSFLGVHQKLG